ncbi:DNA primase large subunit, partial [Phenoliferia sp. Uapishka_3]
MFAGSRREARTSNAGPSTSNQPEITRHAIRAGKFPSRLNFYEQPPTEEITLEEFETWAIDRLRVLADIESAQARNRTQEDLRAIVNARLKTYLPLGSDSAKGVDLDAERRKDVYSHFVLRLAFCRSEELRDRFLKVEKVLFRIRWESDDPDERRKFIESLNFGWEVVSAEEKDTFRAQLAAASGLRDDRKVDGESYFKVHWTKVSDLVDHRKVFIHRGQAYVPIREELSLVSAEFTSRLSRNLEMTAKALPRLDEDDRLLPILSHLSMGFTSGISSEYTVATNKLGEAITAEMIPSLAQASFPFCMRNMQDTLKSSHHLKHEGRQQLNLFLKGIGLSVEEAVFFWRKSFSNITDDKFNKEYRYNVRHGYGLEGSRKSYSPKNCVQIITGKVPGQGEAHGCPFRHFSEANLATALSVTYNLSMGDQKEIINATKQKQYHVACTRLFEIQHASKGVAKGDGIGKGDSVDHPNRYFDASRELYIGKVKDEEGAVKAESMEVD